MTVDDATSSTTLHDALPSRLLHIEKRQWEAPTNLHHAAIAVCTNPNKPLRWRLGMLFGDVVVILAQLLVLVSLWFGVGRNICASHGECNAGYWCMVSQKRCDMCLMSLFEPTGFCAMGAPPPGAAAQAPPPAVTFVQLWNTVIAGGDVMAKGVVPADFPAHCAGCYSDSTGYTFRGKVISARVRMMKLPDHLALCFAALIIALCVTNELRDVQLGARLRRRPEGASAGRVGSGWYAIFWLLDAIRRFALLGALPSTVSALVSEKGADTLNICLNAVAVVFCLEVDNLLFDHGVSVALREWCCGHARPTLGASDTRAIENSKTVSIAAVTLSIIVGVQLEPNKTSPNAAMMAHLVVHSISTLPPLLAEAVTHRRVQILASLLAQWALGFGVSLGAVLGMAAW